LFQLDVLFEAVTRPYYRIRVNSEMKADLRMWLEFLETYSGITFMSEQHWVSNQTLELFTDSAGGQRKCFGIYFQGQWGHGRWPQDWIYKDFLSDITFLEMFPVVVVIEIWSDKLQNKKVLFRVDNEAVVYILNKNTSKSPLVMPLVRKVVLVTMGKLFW